MLIFCMYVIYYGLIGYSSKPFVELFITPENIERVFYSLYSNNMFDQIRSIIQYVTNLFISLFLGLIIGIIIGVGLGKLSR